MVASQNGRSSSSQAKAESGHPHGELSLRLAHSATGRKDLETSACSALCGSDLEQGGKVPTFMSHSHVGTQ